MVECEKHGVGCEEGIPFKCNKILIVSLFLKRKGGSRRLTLLKQLLYPNVLGTRREWGDGYFLSMLQLWPGCG